jgi:hypothetical protein
VAGGAPLPVRNLSETSLALLISSDHPDPSTTTGNQKLAQLTAS